MRIHLKPLTQAEQLLEFDIWITATLGIFFFSKWRFENPYSNGRYVFVFSD